MINFVIKRASENLFGSKDKQNYDFSSSVEIKNKTNAQK
jgi:hypothetical protein